MHTEILGSYDNSYFTQLLEFVKYNIMNLTIVMNQKVFILIIISLVNYLNKNALAVKKKENFSQSGRNPRKITGFKLSVFDNDKSRVK